MQTTTKTVGLLPNAAPNQKFAVTAIGLFHGDGARTIRISGGHTFEEALQVAETLVSDGWYKSVRMDLRSAWFLRVHSVSVVLDLEKR